MKTDCPVWMYKNGEARLFNAGEDIPSGWTDTPASSKGDGDREDLPKRRGRPPKSEATE